MRISLVLVGALSFVGAYLPSSAFPGVQRVKVTRSCIDNDGHELFKMIGEGKRDATTRNGGISIDDDIRYNFLGTTSRLKTNDLLVRADSLKVGESGDQLLGFSPLSELFVEYIPIAKETHSPIHSTIMKGKVSIDWHYEIEEKGGVTRVSGPFIVEINEFGLVGVGMAERVMKGEEIVSASSSWHVRVPRETIEASGRVFQINTIAGKTYRSVIYSCNVKQGRSGSD